MLRAQAVDVQETSHQCNCVKTARSVTPWISLRELMEGCAHVYTWHCFIYSCRSVVVALWSNDQKRELQVTPARVRVFSATGYTAGTAAASWGSPNAPGAEPPRDNCDDVPLRTRIKSNQKPPVAHEPSQLTPGPGNTSEMELKRIELVFTKPAHF